MSRIGWNGGECPVPDGAFVAVWTTVSGQIRGRADSFDWGAKDWIVAYEVIAPAPRDFWIVRSPSDAYQLFLERPDAASEIIHVREVLE